MASLPYPHEKSCVSTAEQLTFIEVPVCKAFVHEECEICQHAIVSASLYAHTNIIVNTVSYRIALAMYLNLGGYLI